MSDCPECGMRDDDWFLCRKEKCAVKTESNPDEALALIEELERALVDARAAIIAWAITSYGEPEKLKSVARIDTALANAKRFKGE